MIERLFRIASLLLLAGFLGVGAVSAQSAAPRSKSNAAKPSPTPTASLEETLDWMASFVRSAVPRYSTAPDGTTREWWVVSGSARDCTIASRSSVEVRSNVRSERYSDRTEYFASVWTRDTTARIPLYEIDRSKTGLAPFEAGWMVQVSTKTGDRGIVVIETDNTVEECTTSRSDARICGGYPRSTYKTASKPVSNTTVGPLFSDKYEAERLEAAVEHATALCAGFRRAPPAGSPF